MQQGEWFTILEERLFERECKQAFLKRILTLLGGCG